ncbi:hypothetical protein [Uliginosibacterium sp. H1]|uniref:hypothetical protein n=1 Tax=Uliginosibacterium sp. H1 TaxID=3114757 RepID=UPI002E186637|nr:hypothetical protein [Uliginosibacterium sp. H1]
MDWFQQLQWLDYLQWPAMLTNVIAAWMVASRDGGRRTAGFWWFTAGNVLWTAWGLHTQAYALILLQLALFALNMRGIAKNDDAA